MATEDYIEEGWKLYDHYQSSLTFKDHNDITKEAMLNKGQAAINNHFDDLSTKETYNILVLQHWIYVPISNRLSNMIKIAKHNAEGEGKEEWEDGKGVNWLGHEQYSPGRYGKCVNWLGHEQYSPGRWERCELAWTSTVLTRKMGKV